MATIAEALTQALHYHQAGQLPQAEQLYRQILEVDPVHAPALHFLGIMAHQLGQQRQALDYLRQAVGLAPVEATFHNNLGLVFQSLGQLEEASASFRQALQLRPDYFDAHVHLGKVLRERGQLNEAVASYRQALHLRPDVPEVHNDLGTALRQGGLLEEAITCYRQALHLRLDFAEAHNNLGTALGERGQLDEALASFRRALRIRPDFPEAHNNLGCALRDLGQLDDAISSFREALRLRPDYAEAAFNLANALWDGGQVDQAIASYRQALILRPNHPEAHNNLGTALCERGQREEAIAGFRQALRLRPDFAEALNNLGNALKDQGRLDEAIANYRQALRLRPDYAEPAYNLGNALQNRGLLDEAIACFRQAVRQRPNLPEAHINLGNALMDQGRLDEAIACYRRVVEIKPDDAAFHSNLLYALHFCPGYDSQAIYEEHRRWNQQHAEALGKSVTPHANERTPRRRLRVGYVSPDFRGHPVGQFLLPLLEAHERGDYEVFCYAAVAVPDSVTERCRGQADVWRHVLGFSDEQLAQAIRQDRIDILVDLTMHMAHNRLLVFARKPAPVQVTYLAYCGTTGLTSIDYRFTDPYLDPPGQGERYYSEQSVRLPESYWCYRPLLQTPPVTELPASRAGQVTFGCLNNFCKVSEPTLAAWSSLLQALPGAQLLVHAKAGSHRQRVHDFLAQHQVDPGRLTFLDWVPLAENYYRAYERIDIAVDPFPYGGGTTSCDALWMGVPVVSLAGQTAVGRAGLSILSNVGLPELVARDVESYVRLAAELANDLPRLRQLRATLRERMQASPLMDAPRFARNVEAAYRKMWQAWCDRA